MAADSAFDPGETEMQVAAIQVFIDHVLTVQKVLKHDSRDVILEPMAQRVSEPLLSSEEKVIAEILVQYLL